MAPFVLGHRRSRIHDSRLCRHLGGNGADVLALSMTKHTILFQYYQAYQNQNNVNQQDANQSGHRHMQSKPSLSPSVGWLRVVCFFHYTVHRCKAQSKIYVLAIFQTLLPKNVKSDPVKSEKITTALPLQAGKGADSPACTSSLPR